MTEIVNIENERGETRKYETVASRLVRFRATYPAYSVNSHIIHIDDDMVRMRVEIGWINEAGAFCLLAAAHAEEWRDTSDVNRTAALENCETSALGRALAFLGFGSENSIASADEVEGAKRRGRALDEKEPGTLILLQNAAKKGTAELQRVWEQELDIEGRKACSRYMPKLKRLAKERDGDE